MVEVWSTFTIIIVYGLLIMNILAVLTVIFLERRDIGATWAWVFILYFVPLVGFLVYLFFGRLLKKSNFYRITEEEQLEHDRRIALQKKELVTMGRHPMIQKHRDMIRMNLMSNGSLLSLSNQLQILSDGEQKFNRMIQDIRQAEHEVNIQYYIIQKDRLGLALIDTLTECARRGIKVRLLYDAVGSRSLKRTDFKDLLVHGGEVFAFFPVDDWFR